MDTTYDNIDTSQTNQNGGIAWSTLSVYDDKQSC